MGHLSSPAAWLGQRYLFVSYLFAHKYFAAQLGLVFEISIHVKVRPDSSTFINQDAR